MQEAMLYEKLSENKVRCSLCAHRCLIADGHRGLCRVRENRKGILYTLTYGRTITQHTDPIEKKPLFHFHPGSAAYSIATVGCNFRCRWCQNADISQAVFNHQSIPGHEAAPDSIVDQAKQAGCRSIAYTYTEPTIFYEYAYQTARLAQKAGLGNLFVTNGYMTAGNGEALDTLHPYLDAANVDLKAFRDETYLKYTGARLQPVLDAMKKMKALDIWLEVTTLVIPHINDSVAELKDAALFVAQELGPETPWHISRFFPAYYMIAIPPTPIAKLHQAREIGYAAGLRHIYIGNVPGEQNTLCHSCGKTLIVREGYRILANHITDGCCPACHTPVAGVGMSGTLT